METFGVVILQGGGSPDPGPSPPLDPSMPMVPYNTTGVFVARIYM